MRLLEDVYKEGCTCRIIVHKQNDEFPIRRAYYRVILPLQSVYADFLEAVFRKLDWENAE